MNAYKAITGIVARLLTRGAIERFPEVDTDGVESDAIGAEDLAEMFLEPELLQALKEVDLKMEEFEIGVAIKEFKVRIRLRGFYIAGLAILILLVLLFLVT